MLKKLNTLKIFVVKFANNNYTHYLCSVIKKSKKMKQQELNQLMSELTSGNYNSLMSAIVSYNSDPLLIEGEEEAEELAKCIMADGSIIYTRTPNNVDDWDDLCSRLDLDDATIIYEVINYNDCRNNCIYCLSNNY